MPRHILLVVELLEDQIIGAGGKVASCLTSAVTTLACKSSTNSSKKVEDATSLHLKVILKEDIQDRLNVKCLLCTLYFDRRVFTP